MNNVISYWPEMKDKFPEGVVGNVHYGSNDHYMVETPLTLKGRGIKFIETLQSDRLTAQGQYKAGWNYYRVSEKALAALPYQFAREALLD